MAPRNKLLKPIGGVPMVRRVAGIALESGARPVVVVTGHEAARVTDVLAGLEVITIHNLSYAEGLSASLRVGLNALPGDIDGVLICLGDMPWVEVDVLWALIEAFCQTGTDAICVPVSKGRRGNPVLWGSAYFPEITTMSGDRGAKPLMAQHEGCVVEVEVMTESIFEDLDEPQDLEGLETRLAATS
jgi:molybdenum cofactor cytidylyltransferase